MRWLDTKKIVSARKTSIGAKTWMVCSLLIETTMTIVTWAAIPLFFKIWSVVCLMIDAFLILREFVLNPVRQRRAIGIYV
jgi:hypothetical protein